MDDIDTATQNSGTEPAPVPTPGDTARLTPTRAPEDGATLPAKDRLLDLIALLVLIALSAAVFTIAGPTAFTAVTSVGLALFATWRSAHRPPR
jgi:hypothetical protein